MDTIQLTKQYDTAVMGADKWKLSDVGEKYALAVFDPSGKMIFSIAYRTFWQRVAHAFRSSIAIFTGKTVL